MKREACMLKMNENMPSVLANEIIVNQYAINSRANMVGAKNVSAWTVEGYVYIYAEFDDANPASLSDILEPFMEEIDTCASFVARPGEMRKMYHDIGIVHEDKKEIRRRVFATHLKPGCAEEYYLRHKKLIDARDPEPVDHAESNFTIWCANDEFIFGYCELVRAFDREQTEEEKQSTIAWETRQLEIMDWFTDDVDWITGEKHDKMKNLFLQKGFEG